MKGVVLMKNEVLEASFMRLDELNFQKIIMKVVVNWTKVGGLYFMTVFAGHKIEESFHNFFANQP